MSFIDVEAWARQAEVIAQYMKKGRPLLVEGRLKQDTWEDKNTHQKQSKLKVVMEGFTFIDSRRPPITPRRPPLPALRLPSRRARSPAAAEPEAAQPEEDNVPF